MHFENQGQKHPQKIIMPTLNSSIFLTNSSDYDSEDDASSCSNSSSTSSSSPLASKCSSAKSSASSSSSSLSSRQCPSNDSSLNFSSSSSASSQNSASQLRDQSTNSTSSRQQHQVEIEMLDLLKTSYGPSSPKIAQHLNSLALRHFHTSNDASASLACHREALSILEWNRSHALLFDREEDSKRFAVEMAVTLSDMANVLREGNDFLGSGEAYLESLNLFLDGVVKDGGVIRRVLEEVPLQMTMQMVVGSRSSDDAAAAAFAPAENDALETNWSMENNGPDILSNTSSPYPSEEEGRLRRQMQNQIHLERATLEREIIGINLAEIGTTLSSHPEVQRALRGIDQLLREMQYVKFVAQNAASSRRRRRCIQKSVETSNLTSAIASLNMMSSTATATATTQRMDSSSFSDLGRSVSDADFILEEDDEEDMTLCPPLPSHQYRSTPYLHQVHHQRNLPQDRRIRNYNHYRSSSSSCYPDSCEASPGAATIGESTPVSRPLLPASSRFRTRVGGRGDASTSSSSDLRIVHLQRSKSWASTHSTQEEFQRFFSSAGCDNYPPIGQNYYPYHGHDGYDNDEGSSKNIINRSLSNPQRQSSYPSHGIHHYPRRNSYNNPKLYYTLDNSNRNRYFCYPFRRPNLLARRAITSEEDYDRHVALSVLIIPLENALRCALHRFPGLVNLTNGGGVGRSFSGHPYSSSLSLQGLVDHIHDHDCDTARIGSYEFNLRNKATSTKRSEDAASIHDDEKGHDPMIPSILPKSFTHDESQTHQPIEHDPDVAVRAKDTDELRPKEVIATIGLPMDGFLEKDSKIISTITNPSSSSSPSAVAVGTSGNSSTTHHTAHYQNPAVANIITANKNHPLIISQLSSTPEDGSCMTSPRTTAKIELNYTIPCGGASPRD